MLSAERSKGNSTIDSQPTAMPKRCPVPALVLLGCLGCAGLQHDCSPRGLSFIHHLGEPPPQLQQVCRSVSEEAKDRVHLFAVNGMDPFYLGNLNGLCACMQRLGFHNTYCGEAWHTAAIREQICAIRQQDRDARIAVVGFSLGATRACRLAHELKRDSVTVDLLVYIGGDTIDNVPASRPENVGQIVNITGHGYLPRGGDLFYNGAELDGARNQRLNARHMLLPTRPETVETLAFSLIALAQAP
jgi:hypothetical protein